MWRLNIWTAQYVSKVYKMLCDHEAKAPLVLTPSWDHQKGRRQKGHRWNCLGQHLVVPWVLHVMSRSLSSDWWKVVRSMCLPPFVFISHSSNMLIILLLMRETRELSILRANRHELNSPCQFDWKCTKCMLSTFSFRAYNRLFHRQDGGIRLTVSRTHGNYRFCPKHRQW